MIQNSKEKNHSTEINVKFQDTLSLLFYESTYQYIINTVVTDNTPRKIHFFLINRLNKRNEKQNLAAL